MKPNLTEMILKKLFFFRFVQMKLAGDLKEEN